MNNSPAQGPSSPRSGTAADLLAAAAQLFAARGYDGASVRDITRKAGANLGAVTYHFGSKDALYEAVFAAVAEPSTAHLAAACGEGPSLDRVERFVRAQFEYLRLRPELPRLLAQHLAGSRPLPEAARRTMQRNMRLLAAIIGDGQRERRIRDGDPALLALSVGSQPIFLSLMRRALREGGSVDQDNPRRRATLVNSVVAFVRAGLARDGSRRHHARGTRAARGAKRAR